MIEIGSYRLPNNVALAPMAGVTDLPFRRLCSQFGAGLVVSEMISSNPRLRHSPKTQWRSQHDHEIAPRSVQIAGSEPLQMAAAARYNVERGAQIIDINMGCPAKKVCRKAAGSALLADEARVKSILLAVIDAVDVPVTLKIRTGSAPGARNGVSIAHIAEDAGIAALAVHGRTRACAFTGHAEYDTIAAIVAAINIPVFANGDINSPQMAAKVIAHTGAAGVMIGRAAQGRPWLCGQIATYLDTGVIPAPPSSTQQLATLHRHVTQLHQFYGDFMGVRIARKHVGWYLNADRDMREQHRQFNRLTAPEEQLYYIQQLSGFAFNKEIAA
ncbi:MAG: tRNA dihydrouridine synthase DusB [Halioglobus sp.]